MQVFYRSHIIGAIIFTVFGVVHLSNVWEYLSAGLLVYGIDVAYRWLQTSTDVEVSLSAGGNLVNIIVPLQVRTAHCIPLHADVISCKELRDATSMSH